MEKFDIKKACKTLYSAPTGEFSIVDVPPFDYFMIDGAGDPNSASTYKAAVEALYGVAYTLKFASKVALGRDHVVPPLEGLWWADDMADFVARRKDRWRWTMMIAVPDFIERSMAQDAIAKAKDKKRLPALQHLRVEQLEEGQAVQTLHVGSYDDEGPTLDRLHREFLPARRLAPTGHHHEIYLSDPRKTPAEKLKTILRQPVGPRAGYSGSTSR
ncbi:MAG: GyrI-like domain-containing protein [Reyranellaceae bacterium]